jgi:hypothetical protein
VAALNFFNDDVAVRKQCFILGGWEAVAANNAVEFFLGVFLDVGVYRNQGSEPLRY